MRIFLLTLVPLTISAVSCKNGDKKSLPSKEAVEASFEKKEAEAPATPAPTQAEPAANALNGNTKQTNSDVGGTSLAKDEVRITGKVKASNEGSLSFKVKGFIAKINVKEGDEVQKGQILASLEDTDSRLQLNLAQQNMEQALIQRDQAKRDLDREKELKSSQVTTLASYEKTLTNYKNLELNYAQSVTRFNIAKKTVDDGVIRAPYDATIVSVLHNENEFLADGKELIKLYHNDNLEFHFKVPANLLSRFKLGDKINIFVPSMNMRTEMKLTRIVNFIEESSHTFEIYGEPVQKDVADKVVPGMFIEATL